MDIKQNVSAPARRTKSESCSRSALLFGLACMISTSACLSAQPARVAAHPFAVVDPLARVAGVATAHRNDDDALVASEAKSESR